jgi:hypothetical protein
MKLAVITLCLCLPTLALADHHKGDEGWTSIFDGKSLDGWSGDPKFWSVVDGVLQGKTTEDNATKGNTFAIWTGGETGDFELKLQYKIIGGNSGIQYRSFKLEKGVDEWRLGGYQADIDSKDTYSGILYGEQFRGILANRGLVTVLGDDGKPNTVGTVGDSKEIQSKIKKEDWNDYHVSAKGFKFVHRINGVVTSECTDKDGGARRDSGVLGLQLHAGPPMVVQFRNIKIKHLGKKKPEGAAAEIFKDDAKPKKKGQEPSDDINALSVQVAPNGGYVVRTKVLDETGLKALLSAVGEMNPDATVRIQAGKGGPEAAKKARAAAKSAGVKVLGKANRGKGKNKAKASN